MKQMRIAPTLIWYTKPLLVIFVFTSLFTFIKHSEAHGLMSDRLAAINREVVLNPNDAKLYIKRGRIFQNADHWQQALTDFKKAEAVDPTLNETLYWQGLAHLKLSELKDAKTLLARYLEKKPDAALGYRLLAHVYLEEKLYSHAEKNFDLAIAKDKNATPSLYIERARAQQQIKPLPSDRIQRGLNEGIAMHGNIVLYVSELVELYRVQNDYLTANKWINTLPCHVQESIKWQMIKADIASASGKPLEAKYLYQSVLDKINELPSDKKRATAFSSAQMKAKKALKNL